MAFIESPRFPDAVSFGFRGGPGYSTDVVKVDSGFEFRNANWSDALRRYEASHAARLPAAYRPLQAFFHIAKGKANTFRVKDWTDYRDNDAGGSGVIGIIDTTHFQLYKRYTSGSSTYNRIIKKPVSGRVSLVGSGTYSLDSTTGIITKTAGAAPSGWTGEFDVPCRFDVDELLGEIIDKQANGEPIIGWDSIPIVEVRI